jgi:pimeloyl-ACP methyl ester carboxylesterase
MSKAILPIIFILLLIGVRMTNAQMYKSGYLQVNGIKMYYEIRGEGDPLVLIHGGGSTIESTFGRVLPMLAENFRVIAVEMQAHGRTGDRDAPESFEQDADDAAELLRQLKVPKASFFGFSNGGNTVIQIAKRHPEIVDKLILASTFYKREGLIPGLFEGMEGATIENMPQSLREAFLKVNPDSSKLLNMFNKDKARMLSFRDWDDSTLSTMKAPTLIISGDKDVILPEHAVAMSKLIAGSRLMILPAVHGGYIGAVDFTTAPDDKMIKWTIEEVKNFLMKESR